MANRLPFPGTRCELGAVSLLRPSCDVSRRGEIGLGRWRLLALLYSAVRLDCTPERGSVLGWRRITAVTRIETLQHLMSLVEASRPHVPPACPAERSRRCNVCRRRLGDEQWVDHHPWAHRTDMISRLERSVAKMTAGGRGFLVEAGRGRATRVPIPNSLFKAVGTDTNG